MLDQLHAQLHLWIARFPAAGDPSTVDAEILVSPRDEHLLSDAERRRHRRYIRAADRDAFLVAHVFLRRTLSCYIDVAPDAWTFESNRYGRPEISNRWSPPGLRFNLSHTDGMVVVLVHDDVDGGVDVERTDSVENLVPVADTVFAESERLALLRLPADEQRARFYRLWTLKEAFIKAKGMGLSLPLKDFWFSVDDPMAPRLRCLDSIDRYPEAWDFTVCDPSPHHALAVACRSGIDQPAREVKVISPGSFSAA